MVLDQGLACCPDRVQGVALGSGPAGWSLGPADLHHPLVMRVQEPGKPSAVAAGTLHRPTATSRHLPPGEGQQLLVAGRVGAHRGLGEHATNRVGDGGGEAVAVGVDTDHPINGAGQPSHPSGSFLLVAWSCRPGGRRAALL
jgi:hypothetical protein